MDRWLIKVKKDTEKHFRRTWEQLALMFSVSCVPEAILFGHPSPECLQGCQGGATLGSGGVGVEGVEGVICRIDTFRRKISSWGQQCTLCFVKGDKNRFVQAIFFPSARSHHLKKTHIHVWLLDQWVFSAHIFAKSQDLFGQLNHF